MPHFWKILSQATCHYLHQQYLLLAFLQLLISSWGKKKKISIAFTSRKHTSTPEPSFHKLSIPLAVTVTIIPFSTKKNNTVKGTSFLHTQIHSSARLSSSVILSQLSTPSTRYPQTEYCLQDTLRPVRPGASRSFLSAM